MTAEVQYPPSYSALVTSIDGLSPNTREDRRDLVWVVPDTLGVCRVLSNEVVIVLAVGGLLPRSKVVARHTVSQTIYRSRGSEPVSTTMLTLPASPHFDQFAAFICSELVRRDAEADLHAAFHESEPLIELAFTHHRKAVRTLYALAARVALLARLVSLSDDATLPSVIESWCSQVPFRDFRSAGIGVIIRATETNSSTTDIHDLAEVSPSPHETSLILLKVLVQDSQGPAAFTIPALLDSVFERLSLAAADWIEPLMGWTKAFRRSDMFEYVHADAAEDSFYGRSLAITASTTLDLAAETAGLLRQDDLKAYPDVVPTSVSYKIRGVGRSDDDARIGLDLVAAAIISDFQDS